MKQNLQITLTLLYGVSLVGLLAGCSMPKKEDIAKNTTEFNLVAEKTGNEMLLLNIVRASKRRPMYFTSFGKLTGQMSFEVGTGGINIPFGKSFKDPYSIAPNASYKNSPLFDVAVLDTQEFTNGIMKPVPMSIIEYYQSQGWPPEMLLHLFIRRIDIKDPNNPKTYVNDPEDWCEFEKFQNLIQTEKWDIAIDPNRNPTKIGQVDVDQILKMQNMTEVQKAGLKLKKDNDKMDLYLSEDKYVFTYEKSGQKMVFSKERGKIYTRSPEAILYYLGEIMRVENNTKDINDKKIPKIDVSHDRSGKSLVRLFYARKADKDKSPCVCVNYEGAKYIIPGDPDGKGEDRSMHVLSLVSQLIGLQKKSTVAPATATVSVIGR